jgi:hypothetical protein
MKPSSFSDQVADKFYQQVIEAENHNVINKESHLKLSFFDPSDLNTNHLKAKPENLVFNAETVQEYMVNDIVPTSTVQTYIIVRLYQVNMTTKNYLHTLHLDHMISYSVH